MAIPKKAPKSPCGPSPIEKFTANPAIAERTKSQKPQRFHLRSTIAEITLITQQIARAHKAQSVVRRPFRRSHSVPNKYIGARAEFTMMTNTKYVVRHPCRPDPTGVSLGLLIAPPSIAARFYHLNEN